VADNVRLKDLLIKELERKKDDPDVLSEIGAIFLRNGEEKAGLLWFFRALSKDRNHTPTHQLLADYYKQQNHTELAAKHLEMAKQGSP
jgi:Tfp pilus assembly protein PilF